MTDLYDIYPTEDSEEGAESTRGEFLRRAALLGVTLPAAGSLLSTEAVAAIARLQSAGRVGGHIAFAQHEAPLDTLDLHKSRLAGTAMFLEPVYDRLVWGGAARRLVPGLANSWTVSPNARSFTFRLRRGVRFHDGTEFNAQSVKANFDRIANPGTQSLLSAAALGPYSSTDVLDEFTARVNFTRPYGAFLIQLGSVWLGVVSPAAVARFGDEFARTPTGTGPFRLRQYGLERIVLERNPVYRWGPRIFRHVGPAYLNELHLSSISEPATRLATLLTRQNHFISQVSDTDRSRLTGNRDFRLFTVGSAGLGQFLYLNVGRPPTNELRVRQAIAHAIDAAAIVRRIYQGNRVPARNVLEPAMVGYQRTPDGYLPYNPRRAEALLDQAGWRRPSRGAIRRRSGRSLTVSMVVTPGFEVERFAPLIQAQLRQVGIEVRLLTLEVGATVATLNSGQFNVGSASFFNVDSSLLRTWFGSTNLRSYMRSGRVDRLLTQGEASADPARRAAFYREIIDIVQGQAAAVPLFNKRLVYGAVSSVRNMRFSSEGYPRWNDATVL
jgi:peptide/nickel transport system substrate-binding protein